MLHQVTSTTMLRVTLLSSNNCFLNLLSPNIWLLNLLSIIAWVVMCTYRGLPQFSEDILRLCVKYKDQGVVGIDIAGRCLLFQGRTTYPNFHTLLQEMRRGSIQRMMICLSQVPTRYFSNHPQGIHTYNFELL